MHVNKTIIVGTIIIITAGAYQQLLISAKKIQGTNQTLTRVVVGGYIVAIVLSIADLFTPLQPVAAAFLMLAVVTALFVTIPDLASRVQKRG